MSKIVYDIFISYRRDGGGATAGRINDMLTTDGYSVSYDVDTLREGRFDTQLLERIEQCQDFILVVDKNCFARTVDAATDPLDDWLWQELKYALQLKKNVIPVLLAGADFPKKLPEDIDYVRFCNGPKCVHEYFDSFYTKLKEMLRAYPRLAKPTNVGPTLPTKNMACLKLKVDIDCVFYLDGEERSHLRAGIIQKFPLAKGEYELMFVSEENGSDRLELEFEMPDVDKLQKVNLSDAKNARLQKEAEAKRITEEKRLAEEKKMKEEVERKAEAEWKRHEEEERTKEKKESDSTIYPKLNWVPVEKDGKYGFIDADSGSIKIECEWKYADIFKEGLARVQNADGLWGFIDYSGESIIPCAWRSASNFKRGLAKVQNKWGDYGYVDRNGFEIIPCRWGYADSFVEGLARVKDPKGKYGFVNRSGEIVIPCEWINAYSFKNNQARVQGEDGDWRVIDRKGKIVNKEQ